MKKNKKILIVVTILLVILLSFVGGQAYAKYFMKTEGKGIAQVAIWDFIVNGNSKEEHEIRLTSGCDDETLIKDKIAPGTSGSFNIMIEGVGSGVGIQYEVFFKDEKNKPRNLKLIYEGVQYDSIEELNDKIKGVFPANNKLARDKQRIINIGWEWKYRTGEDEAQMLANDLIDTQDAKNIRDYTFTAVVTGTQVEPNQH